MRVHVYLSYSRHSFVKATLKVQDVVKNGYFMIDTGSSSTILNMHFFKNHACMDIDENKRIISTSSGTSVIFDRDIEGMIEMGGVTYSETFNMCELPPPMFTDDDMKILGILGIDFLVNNHIVIDYEHNNLRTANSEDMEYSKHYSTIASVIYGLNHYGIPVLGINNEENDTIMLAVLDTGSNINIICDSGRERFGFKSKEIITEEKSSFYGVNDESESSKCIMDFGLMCQRDEKIVYPHMSSEFDVDSNTSAFIAEEGEYPVEGIIGNDFLMENKCIINCAAGYVYSGKWENVQVAF